MAQSKTHPSFASFVSFASSQNEANNADVLESPLGASPWKLQQSPSMVTCPLDHLVIHLVKQIPEVTLHISIRHIHPVYGD